MKLTFSFQTLILSVLAATLTIATAVWAVIVYESVYSVILRGFDQKLLAISGGAAVFTDGDAHAAYQRERQLTAFAGGTDGQLWGFDGTRGELLQIEAETGGATPVALDVGLPGELRALAFDAATQRLVALDGHGALIHLRGTPPQVAVEVPSDVTELLFIDGALYGRAGQTLHALDAGAERRELAEPVARLGMGEGELLGLSEGGDALLHFAADGALLSRTPIDIGERTIVGLARHGDTVFLAADSLLKFDLASGELNEDAPPGYYSETDPFIERHAPAYRWVREATGLTFLYTLLHIGEDNIRYILDGSVGDDHTPPGTMDVVPEDSLDEIVLAQSRGQPFVSDIRQWEQWGLIKVSAEPIRDAEGKVVALAGADVDIGVIRAKTRNALFAVLFVGAGLLVLAGSVSLRVSQGLTRPLREIKNSALSIAAGYFDTRLNRQSSDEIGALAASLDALSERLDAQARQAEAYQRALISGRMELALQHALGDLLDQSAATTPIESAEGVPVTAVGNAAYCLLWHGAAGGSGLQQRIADAQTAALAEALLQQMAPQDALDTLFAAQPQLRAVGLWQAATRELVVRCREPLRVRCDVGNGGVETLDLADRSTLRLAPGQRLVWNDTLRLRSAATSETTA